MAQTLFDFFLHWLNKPNEIVYLFIFVVAFLESFFLVGLFLPGTIFMLFLGVFASYGNLFIPFAILAAAVGAFLSDLMSYTLGFRWGAMIVDHEKKYVFFRKHITTGKKFLRTHGGKSVLIGKFLGPVRSFMPFVAGLCYMKPLPFVWYDAIGSFAWSSLLIGLGLALHKSWEHVQRVPYWVGWSAFFLLVVLVCWYVFSRLTRTLSE